VRGKARPPVNCLVLYDALAKYAVAHVVSFLEMNTRSDVHRHFVETNIDHGHLRFVSLFREGLYSESTAVSDSDGVAHRDGGTELDVMGLLDALYGISTCPAGSECASIIMNTWTTKGADLRDRASIAEEASSEGKGGAGPDPRAKLKISHFALQQVLLFDREPGFVRDLNSNRAPALDDRQTNVELPGRHHGDLYPATVDVIVLKVQRGRVKI
jgi:hypothetical protein